jgi:DNA-binding CsgD family transcriptional regulator
LELYGSPTGVRSVEYWLRCEVDALGFTEAKYCNEKLPFVQILAMNKTGHQTRSLGRADRALSRQALTIREREVMGFAAKGFTNKAIARELNLAEGTIKLHLHRIYQKLGVRSRLALAASVTKSSSGRRDS